MFHVLKLGLHSASAAWKRRAIMRALHHLDDRLLKDIGLHRSEIGSALQNTELLRNR